MRVSIIMAGLSMAVGGLLAAPWSLGASGMKCGSSVGVICPTDQYCSRDNCGNIGHCVPKASNACFGAGGAVCGCDGVTYPDSCTARKNGTDVASYHECDGEPPVKFTPVPSVMIRPLEPLAPRHVADRATCSRTNPCPQADQWCFYDGCDDEAGGVEGKCVRSPMYCPGTTSGQPVCGCDGFTYSSSCEAFRAKVTAVASRGPCAPSASVPSSHGGGGLPWPTTHTDCSTVGGVPCDDPQAVCLIPVGQCRTGFLLPRREGYCLHPRSMCVDNGTVCGCNGVEYSSDCEAYERGVSLAHYSPCLKPPKQPSLSPALQIPPVAPEDRGTGSICSDNSDCQPMYYCYTPNGQCNGYGVCRGRSAGCYAIKGQAPDGTYYPIPPMAPQPVCGCDGKTYVDECQAGGSGTSIAGLGVCDPVPADTPGVEDGSCDEDTDCDDDEFCNFDKAACGNQPGLSGFCMKVPMWCPGIRGLERFAESRDEAKVGGIVSDGSATNVAVPESAPVDIVEFQQVCGCDGETYVSSCVAHRYRISVERAGLCLEE